MFRRAQQSLITRGFACLAMLALLVSLHGHGCAPTDCCGDDDSDCGAPIHLVCGCAAHVLVIPEPPLLPLLGVSSVLRYERYDSRPLVGYIAAPEPPPNRAS
jgi:hypothetical protein